MSDDDGAWDLLLRSDSEPCQLDRQADCAAADAALLEARRQAKDEGSEELFQEAGAASVWIGFADAGGADANHDGTVDRAEFTAYGRAMVSVGAALARRGVRVVAGRCRAAVGAHERARVHRGELGLHGYRSARSGG